MTSDAIAMIERCATRQMDGFVPQSPSWWLWIVIPPPGYEDNLTAGQQTLISVKLG